MVFELGEGGVVGGGGGVGVGVVVAFGGDDAEPGVEFEEVAVVFVGFDDEEIAVPRVFAGAGPREGGADDVADGEGEFVAGPDDHGGGGGFAVGAGDGDEFEFFLFDDVLDEIVAFGGMNAELFCEGEFGVVGGEGGGMDEPVDGGLSVLFLEEAAVLGADREVDAAFAEGVGDGAGGGVGAGDLVAGFGGEDGEGADAGAGYPRKIDVHATIVPLWVVREIKLRRC